MECPCHSQRPYPACCQPFHAGQPAPTPVQLMRSRYAAYALGNIRYILQSEQALERSRPEQIAHRKSLKQFAHSTSFNQLQILAEASLSATEATVTFFAGLSQGTADVSFTETSLFEKRNGRWYYLRALRHRAGFSPH